MHSGSRAMRFPPSTYPSASGVDVFFLFSTECCNDFGFGDQGLNLNLNDTHYDMYERAVTFEGPDFHSEASHIIFWLYDMLYTCTILHPKSMQ